MNKSTHKDIFINVKRTFHPIGQGGFYTETVKIDGKRQPFVMVYDCGKFPKPQAAEVLVSRVAGSIKRIDLLVISHFDSDHVNLIPHLLKNVSEIKNVLVPYIKQSDFELMMGLADALGEQEVGDLLWSLYPEHRGTQSRFQNGGPYFSESRVIKVEPFETPKIDEPRESDDFEFYDEFDLPTGDLVSLDLEEESPGQQITLSQHATISAGTSYGDWRYIVRNIHYKERRLVLETELAKHDINLTDVISGDLLKDSAGIDKLRRLYRSIPGFMNSHSMLVYSGYFHSSTEYEAFSNLTFANRTYRVSSAGFEDHNIGNYSDGVMVKYKRYKKVSGMGCLLTGDFPSTTADLQQIFPADILDSALIVQCPHHGSAHNFSIDNLLGGQQGIFMPMHVGLTNSYRHPHAKALNDIQISGNIPILVTDDALSAVHQDLIIWLDSGTETDDESSFSLSFPNW